MTDFKTEGRTFKIIQVQKSVIFDDAFLVVYKDMATGINSARYVDGFVNEDAITPVGILQLSKSVTDNYEESKCCVTQLVNVEKETMNGIEKICEQLGISAYALFQALSKYCCDPANQDKLIACIQSDFERAKIADEDELKK